MILACDRKNDGLVLDLLPKRGRDVVELHQLALHSDKLADERRAGAPRRSGLIEHVLADVHHITYGKRGNGVDPPVLDGTAKESADDVQKDVLFEVLGPVDLELTFVVDEDCQYGGKCVLYPFFLRGAGPTARWWN